VGHLAVRGLGKAFGTTRALAGVDLDVGPGEILGVTGASGAGKSTLCRIVAGVEAPSEGDVLLDGAPVTGVAPERRRVAFMFESYALYPQFTVFENVAFPLRAPGARLPEPLVAERVREVLRFVEIDHLEARRPAELSGGQKQRVALCRALVQEPRAWLLDEPLSHLDAKLRHVLRGAIRRRLTATDTPGVWTSPDALEALAVADRVAVLVAGRVAQVAPAAEIYRRPATVDVARLVGDPPMNLLEGEVIQEDGVVRFRHAAFGMALPPAQATRLAGGARVERAVLGLRPAEIRVGDGEVRRPVEGLRSISARGEAWVWEPLGKHGILTVRLEGDLLKVKVPRTARWAPGDPVALDLGAAEPVLFDARTGRAI
jgi:multiple sugar transport system ATP-binding protein